MSESANCNNCGAWKSQVDELKLEIQRINALIAPLSNNVAHIATHPQNVVQKEIQTVAPIAPQHIVTPFSALPPQNIASFAAPPAQIFNFPPPPLVGQNVHAFNSYNRQPLLPTPMNVQPNSWRFVQNGARPKIFRTERHSHNVHTMNKFSTLFDKCKDVDIEDTLIIGDSMIKHQRKILKNSVKAQTSMTFVCLEKE